MRMAVQSRDQTRPVDLFTGRKPRVQRATTGRSDRREPCTCLIAPMNSRVRSSIQPLFVAAALIVSAAASAQTRVVPPPNKYSTAEDVRLGRQAAAEAERQLPMLHDSAANAFVAGVGRRLVAAIPPQLQ